MQNVMNQAKMEKFTTHKATIKDFNERNISKQTSHKLQQQKK